MFGCFDSRFNIAVNDYTFIGGVDFVFNHIRIGGVFVYFGVLLDNNGFVVVAIVVVVVVVLYGNGFVIFVNDNVIVRVVVEVSVVGIVVNMDGDFFNVFVVFGVVVGIVVDVGFRFIVNFVGMSGVVVGAVGIEADGLVIVVVTVGGVGAGSVGLDDVDVVGVINFDIINIGDNTGIVFYDYTAAVFYYNVFFDVIVAGECSVCISVFRLLLWTLLVHWS